MKEVHLKPKDLAERWGVPETTLSQWRWNGRGPKFMKLGKHIAYSIVDVEIFEKKRLRQDTTCTGYGLTSKIENHIKREMDMTAKP